MNKNSAAGLVAALTLLVSFSPSTEAGSITAGDVVIYRVGDGVAALGTTATAVFLDEYTPAGTFVQSIPLPTTGALSLSAVGNASTEGIISLSQDGSSLIFPGYRKDVGGTNPSTDAPATTNRVIGSITLSGVPSTSTGLTDPTSTIRSATTVNGSSYYISTAVAVRYVAAPGSTSTSALIDTRNSRQVELSGNTLFASNGSTTITSKVQSYGTLPTGTTAGTPVVTLAATEAVNGFMLLDLSASVPGDDTLYAISTTGSLLLKYTYDGTSWSANGSIPSGLTANLAGTTSGGNVNLFLTSPTGLFAFTDSSGYGGTLSGTLGSSIAAAGANTGFRGIGIIPVPEPTTLALGSVGMALALIRRRRSLVS